MKIEKVNDSQIRCTLTREDLVTRELKISELAYGTQKARDLFRDMMQQASFEVGFEAEDIPLMIEAVPLNAECIVLIITKVEEPEEIDTRFSRFAPSVYENEEDSTEEEEEVYESGSDISDEVMDLFQKVHKQIPLQDNPSDNPTAAEDTRKVFVFHNLRDISALSALFAKSDLPESILYKDDRNHLYYLVLFPGNLSKEHFGRICNTVSEYGSGIKNEKASVGYLQEHFTPIIKSHALDILSEI